jgi:simple sugar transport system permease protein
MMISGALAGFAAALNFLAVKPDYFRPVTKILSIGFEGISVALISQSHPLGIIFSGILISYLKQGALSMQLFGFDKEITNIVVSVIIYMIGISGFLGTYIKKKREALIVAHHESEEGAANV